MNHSELSSPIRMYWDIGPAPDVPSAEYRRIAEEIAASKFLSLQVTDRNINLSQATWLVLDSLKDRAMALSLVASRSALDADVLDRLGKLPVKILYIEITDANRLDEVLSVSMRNSGKPAAGVSFPVTCDNFLDLSSVVSFCGTHRIGHLLLPMQRLMTPGTCFSFSRKEREELANRLAGIEKPSWLKITIHDPFLWRAFYPAVEFPNGGCQAANTMLYTAPGLDVYPCPMLPIKIGNLRDTPLGELVRSERKKGLRREILKRPAVCALCNESNACKGGCRGRTFVMTGSLEQHDPACS